MWSLWDARRPTPRLPSGPGSSASSYAGAAFKIDGEVHASEREGLILAAKNPLDTAHMVLTVAGNSALSTVKSQKADLPADQYMIVRRWRQAHEGVHAA